MPIAGSFGGHVVKLIAEFFLMAYYNKIKATPILTNYVPHFPPQIKWEI